MRSFLHLIMMFLRFELIIFHKDNEKHGNLQIYDKENHIRTALKVNEIIKNCLNGRKVLTLPLNYHAGILASRIIRG